MKNAATDNVLNDFLTRAGKDEGAALYEAYGYLKPLPAEWTEALVEACFDNTRSDEERIDLLELLDRLPADRVEKAVLASLDIDPEAIRIYTAVGAGRRLDRQIEEQLPGYLLVESVASAVDRLVEG